ncbi:hypothetical protein PMI14_03145 [Acidovorax sp. CF316]|uniref:hypothetical protein n=1 Tax=Acidovorax sp. CF316 TaxID=1144317 RepID=UPI00026BD78C|nr:hypothetical protein [Acidovorax sp. CF316]EJE52167.1 hypothetical protein PMI14_03145 [Acidovorax sp. CF316]
MSTGTASEDKSLETSILIWRIAIGLAGACVVGSFIWKFGFRPVEDQSKWGQFGDFIGGFLNPLVAFAAFYWLTQSVKLQKKELVDTRAALEEQAEAAAASVRLQALVALYEVYDRDDDRFEQRIISLEAELRAAKRNASADAADIQSQIDSFRGLANAPKVMKGPLFMRIQAILDEYPGGKRAPQ